MQETTLFRLLFVVYLAVSVAIGLGTQLTTWRQADPLRLDLHCIFGAVFFQPIAIIIGLRRLLEDYFEKLRFTQGDDYHYRGKTALKHFVACLCLFPILSTLGQTAVLILWAINTSKEDFKRYLPGFILICIYTLINLIWFSVLLIPVFNLRREWVARMGESMVRKQITSINRKRDLESKIAEMMYMSDHTMNSRNKVSAVLIVSACLRRRYSKRLSLVLEQHPEKRVDLSSCRICTEPFSSQEWLIHLPGSFKSEHSDCLKKEILGLKDWWPKYRKVLQSKYSFNEGLASASVSLQILD